MDFSHQQQIHSHHKAPGLPRSVCRHLPYIAVIFAE
jgi:hypothetical protein